MTKITNKGFTRCTGKKTGFINVSFSDEKLNPWIGELVDYTLTIEQKDAMDAKSETHAVDYIGFNQSTRRHSFEVTSGETKNKYYITIEAGCECNHGGATGIATGKICSHLKAVYKFLADEPLVPKSQKKKPDKMCAAVARFIKEEY